MAEKILIIDDDQDTLRLASLMLERQGYHILSATSGQEGLDKAQKDKPDLILLDVMMPNMDGYEVTRRLRANPQTVDIPILMFTAKTQLDDKVTGFEVGADDYLTKPTHPSELQSHVRALLARRASSREHVDPPQGEQPGYVIGLIAARGGLGVSTLAINLAASLFKKVHADVILAEMTPGQGSFALNLGFSTEKGLANLLAKPMAEISASTVLQQLTSHQAGFKVLLASNHPYDLHLIDQVNQYENVVACLSSLGRYIVLDLGMGMPQFVQRLLPMIDELLVLVEGAPNTITHTRALIEDLIEYGANKNSLAAVLNNRMHSDSLMPREVVQEQLGYPVSATLTPAPEVFAQASRLNAPAVLCQPESLTTQQINNLVERIREHEAQG